MQGFLGELFNCLGENWLEVDVMLIDFGMLVCEGYEVLLVVVYILLVNIINNLVECDQFDDWEIVFVIDEVYMIIINLLLVFYVVKVVKMW